MGDELELLCPLFILSYPMNVDNIALLIYLFNFICNNGVEIQRKYRNTLKVKENNKKKIEKKTKWNYLHQHT